MKQLRRLDFCGRVLAHRRPQLVRRYAMLGQDATKHKDSIFLLKVEILSTLNDNMMRIATLIIIKRRVSDGCWQTSAPGKSTDAFIKFRHLKLQFCVFLVNRKLHTQNRLRYVFSLCFYRNHLLRLVRRSSNSILRLSIDLRAVSASSRLGSFGLRLKASCPKLNPRGPTKCSSPCNFP